MTAIDLKPCPFCGDEAYVDGNEETKFFAGCKSCYCNVGEAYDRSAMPEHMFMCAEDAVTAWNRRAAADASGENAGLTQAGDDASEPLSSRGGTTGRENVSVAAGAAPFDPWQPILTAPKSMKLLLAYRNRLDKWRTVLGCYYEERTLESSHEESGFAPAGWYEETEAYDEISLLDEPPTHWMPLPAPPQLGRLAMRVEGDWWIAYYAKIGTMDGALELGRIRLVLAEMPKIKAATLEYYKGVMSSMVSGATGAKLEWPTPEQPAPEHEKAGRA